MDRAQDLTGTARVCDPVQQTPLSLACRPAFYPRCRYLGCFGEAPTFQQGYAMPYELQLPNGTAVGDNGMTSALCRAAARRLRFPFYGLAMVGAAVKMGAGAWLALVPSWCWARVGAGAWLHGRGAACVRGTRGRCMETGPSNSRGPCKSAG